MFNGIFNIIHSMKTLLLHIIIYIAHDMTKEPLTITIILIIILLWLMLSKKAQFSF